MLPDKIKELLLEHGLEKEFPQEEPKLLFMQTCCGEEVVWPHHGYRVCYVCGKVADGVILEQPQSAFDKNNNMSSYRSAKNTVSQGWEMRYKRKYRSYTHFRDHLYRYAGSRTRCDLELAKDLMHVDMNDWNAYLEVKKVLKKKKLSKRYRDIFTIIYQLGGEKPKLSSQLIQQCNNDYRALETYFNENKEYFGRKSMPSVYMLLDIILRKNGHEPKYFIPQVKDKKLNKRVQDFFNKFDADIISPWRHLEGITQTDAASLVSMHTDMSVLCVGIPSEDASSTG